jgi:hypothetical protein
MKKISTMLFASLIVVLMIGSPLNPVSAANLMYLGVPPETPHDPECECKDLLPLTGSERNKIVASILKEEIFKSQKATLENSGYVWNGADVIELVMPAEGYVLIGVPFTNIDGSIQIHAFLLSN